MRLKTFFKRFWTAAVNVFIAVLTFFAKPVTAQRIPSDIATTIANAVRDIIFEIVDFLTPIINVIGAAMIIVGLLLIAARQEFYGIRLCIGGGVTLIFNNIVIPLILSLL